MISLMVRVRLTNRIRYSPGISVIVCGRIGISVRDRVVFRLRLDVEFRLNFWCIPSFRLVLD